MHDEIINQAREILTQRLYRTDTLASPQDTASYLALQLGDREQEVFSVIFLDNRNHVLNYQEMFHGSIATTPVYPARLPGRRLSSTPQQLSVPIITHLATPSHPFRIKR